MEIPGTSFPISSALHFKFNYLCLFFYLSFSRSKHVTAIDIDEKKIDYAYHNATIYGVHDHIDFIKGDFFNLAPKLKVLHLSLNILTLTVIDVLYCVVKVAATLIDIVYILPDVSGSVSSS